MKNLKKILAGTIATAMLVASTSLLGLVGTVNAIPWSESSTGLSQPGFNVFTGVPGYGDESDFVRGRVSGTSNAFGDPVNDACADGTQYSVQVYVHNGANQTLNNNGTGPGVAQGTKVKVAVPATTASKISGEISATNAAKVDDTLTINCNGKTMQLSYVAGSAVQQRASDGATAPLSDTIVTTGAPIGTMTPDGNMWGCFNQRVIVYLKVEVKEIPEVPESSGSCKAVSVTVSDPKSRKVTVNSITADLDNATVVGYKIEWGDGTTSNTQTASHTYAKDGTYKIVTSVQVRYADGTTEWKTAASCTKQVSFGTTPPPTELPSTGAGDVVGIFAAVTVAGAVAHRYILGRRFDV